MTFSPSREVNLIFSGRLTEPTLIELSALLTACGCHKSLRGDFPDVESFLRAHGHEHSEEWVVPIAKHAASLKAIVALVQRSGLSMAAIVDTQQGESSILAWIGGRRVRPRLILYNARIMLTIEQAAIPDIAHTAAAIKSLVFDEYLHIASAHAVVEDVARRRASVPQHAYLRPARTATRTP